MLAPSLVCQRTERPKRHLVSREILKHVKINYVEPPDSTGEEMDSFDPYQNWLGIPSQLRPLNHYVLLGIRVFEDDPAKIKAAFESRMESLKQLKSGPRGELSEKVMTQIASAKIELLDKQKKSQYDQQLREAWSELESKRVVDDENEVPQPHAESDLTSAHASQSPSEFSPNSIQSGTKLIPSVALQAPAVVSQPNKDATHTQANVEIEEASWLLHLFDIRILVGLLSIVVVVMTATIFLFSDRDAPNSTADADKSEVKPVSPVETTPKPSNSVQPNEDTTTKKSLNTVAQSPDGSFDLSPALAWLSRPDADSDSNKIANWLEGDRAEWELSVEDRRTGYFYCELTYQAKSEAQFSVELGKLAPRKFTIYPHRDDFTERFIVRLDKSDKQVFRLNAEQVDSIADVKIKRVKLIPR